MKDSGTKTHRNGCGHPACEAANIDCTTRQVLTDPRGEQVSQLERDFPSHQVWYVPAAVGPYTWCARRWDDPADTPHTLHATSAAELAELLKTEAEK